MDSRKENSFKLPKQTQRARLYRSIRESTESDSELACQLQLDEVLAASLAMASPSASRADAAGSGSECMTQTDDHSLEAAEYSRFTDFMDRPVSAMTFEFECQNAEWIVGDKPQEAEWIQDEFVHNHSVRQQLQRRADKLALNKAQDDAFEALEAQYKLFRLRTTSKSDKDGRFVHETSLRAEVTSPVVHEDAHATCSICLTNEITSSNSNVVSEKCSHRFCTECLRQHGETTVKAGKSQIPCPEYECEEVLSTKLCEFLLSAETLLILNRRQVEDALADWERVYCPYTDCSWLQLRPLSPGPNHHHPPTVGGVQCLSCHRYFCLECQVPWHENLTCEEYKSLPEDERSPQDIALLKGLAAEKNWQRCTCGHVVEKTDGCNHITCRCGKEFCYICGQEWRNHLSNLHSCRRSS